MTKLRPNQEKVKKNTQSFTYLHAVEKVCQLIKYIMKLNAKHNQLSI